MKRGLPKKFTPVHRGHIRKKVYCSKSLSLLQFDCYLVSIFLVTTIKRSYKINAPVEKVWQALVDSKEIEGWGGGPAVMDDKVDTEFKLWGGDIHGKNTHVVKGERLIQDWYSGDWVEPSNLTIKLKSQGDKTLVDLLHENVPDDEAREIDDGWNRYYFGEIKRYLELK